jgi:ectoine hydroxylase-related dioxygenase (phytanoyl-CoA dioxygenase family)
MWAITDFRSDNGATLLVPGSHKWGKDREPKDEEIPSAEMSAGSVLYWLGGTLHGAGANVSNDWRYGVILTYSLGWLRQEENQYLGHRLVASESCSAWRLPENSPINSSLEHCLRDFTSFQRFELFSKTQKRF